MANAYSKLDCGIIHSTIWQEPHDVRVSWITMLALKNAQGDVFASIPALAKLNNVTIARMEEIIGIFLSPDIYSRTKEHEGKRLFEIPGGWRVINHHAYRDNLKQPDVTATERKRKQRQRQKSTPNVTACHGKNVTVTDVTLCHAYTDPDPDPNTDPDPKKDHTPLPPKGGVADGFQRFWSAYPKRVNKGQALKAWEQVKGDKLLDEILPSLEKHKAWSQWRKDGGQFIPNPATWLRAEGWANEIDGQQFGTAEYDDAQRANGLFVGDSSRFDV